MVCEIQLSRSQAGPGRTFKQQQKHISQNHVQAIWPLCTLIKLLRWGLKVVPQKVLPDSPQLLKGQTLGRYPYKCTIVTIYYVTYPVPLVLE